MAARYRVKEIFPTLQGEGVHGGRAAVFLRFAGCNLWSGREADRADAACRFCDTDFVGTDGPDGGVFADADALADRVDAAWSGGDAAKMVVCTGGEPLLQLDTEAVAALQARGFFVAVETNGTRAGLGDVVERIDWVCVSPKAGAGLNRWVLRHGDELKLVYPQPGLMPADLEPLDLRFTHRLLQPMDGPDLAANTAAAVAAVQADPRWRLSVQVHKVIGVR